MKKVRARGLFLLLAAVAYLAAGQAAFGQEQEPWQKDWQKFGEVIAPYARDGTVERKGDVREFNRIFSKEVEWSGKLREFYSNGIAKFLKLEMQPIRIPLRDGNSIEVSELSISCAVKATGCERWSAGLIGEQVIFRTELVNRTRGILPVVRVDDIGSDDRRVEIQTYGADLIRVVSK